MYDYNDGSNYIINFTWETDTNASHGDNYAIHITDGTIPEGCFDDWLSHDDGDGWTTLYFQSEPGDMPPADWSIHIDTSSNTATLFDGPGLTGQVIGQKPLPSNQAWHVRFIHSDATSAGFPGGDNLLNLCDFCSERVTGDRLCAVDVSKNLCQLKAKRDSGYEVISCENANGCTCTVLKCAPRFVVTPKANPLFECVDPITGDVGPCDCWPLPDTTRFKFVPRITLRIPNPDCSMGCSYRGVWGNDAGKASQWSLRDRTSAPGTFIAKGRTYGTTGIGSHRQVVDANGHRCPLPGCESCYVAQVFTDSTTNRRFARVHWEGMLLGNASAMPEQTPEGERPCEATLMFRADIEIPLDADGVPMPPSPDNPWIGDANIDGELLCPCDEEVPLCGG